MAALRRGAGAAEQAGLENRSGGNSTVGSNPTLSALSFSITYKKFRNSACNGVQCSSSIAASMHLNLYRRHRPECEAGLSEDARTGEVDERRRGWKKCGCMIHASGTLNGRFRRRQTGKTTWDDAKAIAGAWEKAGSWEGQASQVVDIVPQPVAKRMSIAEAKDLFLAARKAHNIAPPTLRKYRTFMKQLEAFATTQGYVMLDQFTTPDIDRFYGELKMGARTKGKRLSTLRAFFSFCTK